MLERDGELVCLPLEEYAVDPVGKPIRDRADKLARSATGDLYLVAKDAATPGSSTPTTPPTARVWAAARRCYRALGCRHYGLFDFRLDPDGRPWFLEAGLYCSFARTSVVAAMAAAAGIAAARSSPRRRASLAQAPAAPPPAAREETRCTVTTELSSPSAPR